MNDDATLHRRRREREAFHALLDLDAAARDARLAEIAASDPALAAELRGLLDEADADASDFPDAAAGAAIGHVVDGRFRLLRLLGVGGMGEVYLAERTDEVAQKVALKLMRGDLPLPLARARRERQILARLNHPNIAGLIDAGLADNGRPWFAMEYVEGERITDACDHRALDLPRRARLFAKVCRAVQFAHKNLVLHRDLKPSNLLLDAEGVPKLLDFGIAKLLDATDPRETQTQALTPAYAAPEQLRGEAATTASDVYQLGLVLYELLGGVPATKAREAAPSASASLAPPRLDHAFAALAARDPAAAARIARDRSVGVDKLRRQLRGDLGRIVSKATADAPNERYDTAQALADDLDRWAKGLPVSAHRGSFAYRVRKLVRRHALAAAAIALLAVGLVATSFVAVERARTERQQRERAEQERLVAEQQKERAETSLKFLHSIFEEADSVTGSASRDTSDWLRRASAKLDQRTDLDTATRAALSAEIAVVFSNLGERAESLAMAERTERELRPVRATYPSEYLRSVEVLMFGLREAGRPAEVVEIAERALPLAEAMTPAGRHWPAVLLLFRGSARVHLRQLDAAEQDLQASLAEYREAGVRQGFDYANTLDELAHLAYVRGDAQQALDWQRQKLAAVASDADDQLTPLMTQQRIAQIQQTLLGQTQQAQTILEPLVGRIEALIGAAHDRSIDARLALATTYLTTGDWAKAEAIVAAQQAQVANRLATINATVRRNLFQARAKLDLLRGDAASAQRILQDDKAAIYAKSIPEQWLIGEALLQSGRYAAAQQRLQHARAQAARYRAERPDALSGAIADSLGRCRLMQRDFAGAIAELDVAVVQYTGSYGAGAPATVRSQIHRLWAEVLATRRPAALDGLQAKRSDLVRALDGAERPQIWQLDLLIDRLARELGQPGVEVARRLHAEAGLKALSGNRVVPHYVGLSSFN